MSCEDGDAEGIRSPDAYQVVLATRVTIHIATHLPDEVSETPMQFADQTSYTVSRVTKATYYE